MKKRIIFFHMLNDLSGSPRILSVVIKGLLSRGYRAELYTSAGNNGFLCGIEGVKYHIIKYSLSACRTISILNFIRAQFCYFFAVLRYAGSADTVIYINTMLPIGALIGAAVIRSRIICHLHENPLRKDTFHNFSLFLISRFAYRIILVSEFQYRLVSGDDSRKILIYNALPEDFVKRALLHKPSFNKPGNVLMACSLRKYKGVDVFVKVAENIPDLKFTLVLNAAVGETGKYFNKTRLPSNIKIITNSCDMHGFYEKTNLVLNLSQKETFVETFGLTILEAMSHGIPVIVPETGGITELVEDGVNGFRVDTSKPEKVIELVKYLFSDEDRYYKFSESSRRKAMNFSYESMMDRILEVVE